MVNGLKSHGEKTGFLHSPFTIHGIPAIVDPMKFVSEGGLLFYSLTPAAGPRFTIWHAGARYGI